MLFYVFLPYVLCPKGFVTVPIDNRQNVISWVTLLVEEKHLTLHWKFSIATILVPLLLKMCTTLSYCEHIDNREFLLCWPVETISTKILKTLWINVSKLKLKTLWNGGSTKINIIICYDFNGIAVGLLLSKS